MEGIWFNSTLWFDFDPKILTDNCGVRLVTDGDIRTELPKQISVPLLYRQLGSVIFTSKSTKTDSNPSTIAAELCHMFKQVSHLNIHKY